MYDQNVGQNPIDMLLAIYSKSNTVFPSALKHCFTLICICSSFAFNIQFSPHNLFIEGLFFSQYCKQCWTAASCSTKYSERGHKTADILTMTQFYSGVPVSHKQKSVISEKKKKASQFGKRSARSHRHCLIRKHEFRKTNSKYSPRKGADVLKLVNWWKSNVAEVRH